MSHTITIHISDDLRESLATIARHTRRSKSSLIVEAIARYVETASGIIEGLCVGEADAQAGHVINASDDEATRFREMTLCMAGEVTGREGADL